MMTPAAPWALLLRSRPAGVSLLREVAEELQRVATRDDCVLHVVFQAGDADPDQVAVLREFDVAKIR